MEMRSLWRPPADFRDEKERIVVISLWFRTSSEVGRSEAYPSVVGGKGPRLPQTA